MADDSPDFLCSSTVFNTRGPKYFLSLNLYGENYEQHMSNVSFNIGTFMPQFSLQ